MSERNKLSVSPIEGVTELLINGFVITFDVFEDTVIVSVYRKGLLVYSPESLQDAVKWCEE